MADPETIAALKRAYADTIMNMTKEAAARVIYSEKKARRFQQELVTVRDDAIHTLLRLKHVFDSKVKETEIISFKQQHKIEELEAQLGEAEDIVGELRMELRELRDELKKVTNGQTHLQSDHDKDSCLKNSDAVFSVVHEVSTSHERSGAVGSCIQLEQSGLVVVPNGIKKTSVTSVNSINRCSSKDNKNQCHHTLPSILTKRKEAEGCTRMIHAINKSVASGDVNDGECLKVSSCKSEETLNVSGCADASDSISSVRDEEDTMVSRDSSQKDFDTPLPLKTSPKGYENDTMLVIGETEAQKEEKDIDTSILLKTSPRDDEYDRKLTIGEMEPVKEEKERCRNIEVSASSLCEETPVLAVNKNRCIMYTFKRKRKKDALSNPEGDSSLEENGNKKQKIRDKDDGYLESLKPSFTNESSRDSLCLPQVTRQLVVPFAEKKGLAAEVVNQ